MLYLVGAIHIKSRGSAQLINVELSAVFSFFFVQFLLERALPFVSGQYNILHSSCSRGRECLRRLEGACFSLVRSHVIEDLGDNLVCWRLKGEVSCRDRRCDDAGDEDDDHEGIPLKNMRFTCLNMHEQPDQVCEQEDS